MHPVRRARRFRYALPALWLAAAASLLIAPPPAEARMYRWVDAEGRVHVSDLLEQVPEDQRPGRTAFERRAAPVELAVALPPTEPRAERVTPVAAPEAADPGLPGAEVLLGLLGPLGPVVGRISAGSLIFLAFVASPPLALAWLVIGRLARFQLSPSSRSKSA